VNAKYETSASLASTKNTASSTHVSKTNDREQQVMAYVQEHGAITRPEAEELLNVSASTASRLINKMLKSGKLLQSGNARGTSYTAVE
jgi:ATP-dependent DNA helicase RecG